MRVFRLAIIAALTFNSMVAFAHTLNKSAIDEHGSAFKRSAPLSDFSLTDDHDRSVTGKDFAGKRLLLFFGFTHCPEVCPLTMKALAKELRDAGPAANDVKLLFLTVDPERDTVKALHDYVNAFHPNAVGLRGADVDKLAKDLGTFHQAQKNAKNGAVDVMHSSFVYLTDAAHKPIKFFRTPFKPGLIAQELRSLTM